MIEQFDVMLLINALLRINQILKYVLIQYCPSFRIIKQKKLHKRITDYFFIVVINKQIAMINIL